MKSSVIGEVVGKRPNLKSIYNTRTYESRAMKKSELHSSDILTGYFHTTTEPLQNFMTEVFVVSLLYKPD
jgi:hypothetical protein